MRLDAVPPHHIEASPNAREARSMRYESYHNPRLVEKVVGALARFSFRLATWPEDTVSRRTEERARTRLAKGVKIVDLLGVLKPHIFLDQKHLLLELLNSDDFTTLPRVDGPVRAIDVPPFSNEHVNLYTDNGIIVGNDYLVRLVPRVRPGKKDQYGWAAAIDHLDALCRKAKSEDRDEPDPVRILGDFFEKLDKKRMPSPRQIQRHVKKWRDRRAL
jgi:hypothetical protein